MYRSYVACSVSSSTDILFNYKAVSVRYEITTSDISEAFVLFNICELDKTS